MKAKSGQRTLLASVLLSAPGPIVVGLGLAMGRSSTQLADFIRRSAELAAIIVSWAVYRSTQGQPDAQHKHRLERRANLCVGAAMCLSGVAMLAITFLPDGGQTGNVLPGLIIALLGVTANTCFWVRYRALNRAQPNTILAVQSRLYRTKALVDACVSLALAAVALLPGSPVAHYMDIGGSIAVALYLIGNGLLTLWGKRPGAPAHAKAL